jgi:hypothetical protein
MELSGLPQTSINYNSQGHYWTSECYKSGMGAANAVYARVDNAQVSTGTARKYPRSIRCVKAE